MSTKMVKIITILVMVSTKMVIMCTRMITIITILVTMDKLIIVEDVVNVHDDDDISYEYAENSWYGFYEKSRNAPIQEISVEIFGARGPGWERDGGMRQSELDRRRVRREEESAPAAARCQCKCSTSAAAPVHQRWRNLIIGAGFHSVLDPLTCNDK